MQRVAEAPEGVGRELAGEGEATAGRGREVSQAQRGRGQEGGRGERAEIEGGE